MILNTLAQQIADTVRPAGATPAITPITGRPGTIALVWNVGPGGLPQAFTDTLTEFYTASDQHIHGNSVSSDGARLCMLVDDPDGIELAILIPASAAMHVASGDYLKQDQTLNLNAEDADAVEEIFAAIAA